MLISTLENLLNRGLPRSPRAQQLCAQLAGRTLLIEVAGCTRLRLYSDGVTLRAGTGPAAAGTSTDPTAPQAHATVTGALPADATLSGGPVSLLLAALRDPQAALQTGALQLGGDSEVAQQFHELLQLLRPDPEEELALVLGDVPAHALGRLVRSGISWSERAVTTTLANVAEYLAHERGDLVSRAEAYSFLSAVDALREDVDRLAARIELLPQPAP